MMENDRFTSRFCIGNTGTDGACKYQSMGGNVQFRRGKRTCRSRLFGLQTTPIAWMKRSFLLFGLFVSSASGLCGQSPYESSADFAKYAMKLREQALMKVEPQVFV